MKLSVIGTGYVGLVTGVCFAQMGNNVICVDKDESKIKNLKNNTVSIIYEPGIDLLLKENIGKTLSFTTDIKYALNNSDIVFIAVGTPEKEDGSADLNHVLEVAKQIGQSIDHDMIVVNKSTVPVGTSELVKTTIQNILNERFRDNPRTSPNCEIVSNPEFLKEGQAVEDFMKPDRIIIGSINNKVVEIMRELYRPFTMSHERLIVMDPRSAEMTKYAANAILATKISFINEIANICEKINADINKVRLGIGSDKRIGYSFIYPGVGFGGSCFPKDIKALIKTAQNHNYNPQILQSVIVVNAYQKHTLFMKAFKHFFKEDICITDFINNTPHFNIEVTNRFNSYTFAIWGLSFKPGTDDMREAPSTELIKDLSLANATINVYDPKVTDKAKNIWFREIKNINYFDNKYDALNNANGMFLVTEWKEFRSPDFYEMAKRMKEKVIFDGRNQYNKNICEEFGFAYYQVGV